MTKLELYIEVPAEAHQMRVDAFLAKQHPQFSRNQWIDWLRQGKVQSQDKSLIPKDKLKTGQILTAVIETDIAVTEAIAQDIPLNIMYEDASLMVIDKPAGLVVHPGAGQADSTLMNALLHHQPSLNVLPRAGLIHRLDKDTSGLLIIAKTQESYQLLVQAMQARLIKREYLALVHGRMIAGKRIETCFGRDLKNRLKMAVRPTGKIAITHIKVLEHFSQNTLVRVQLETGRTHQIRVHLAHLAHPIVGDKLYGKTKAAGKGPISDALNAFPRQALHATYLSFIHPISKKTLTFTADLPDDFASLLNILGHQSCTS